MPDAPWQCSECGTVNEPAANACRTCGRWPSLFDIEGSTLEDLPPINPRVSDPAPAFDMEPELEPAPVPAPTDDVPPEVEEPDEEYAPATPPWRRLLRFAVPVGVALYILISSALNR